MTLCGLSATFIRPTALVLGVLPQIVLGAAVDGRVHLLVSVAPELVAEAPADALTISRDGLRRAGVNQAAAARRRQGREDRESQRAAAFQGHADFGPRPRGGCRPSCCRS